MDSAGKRNSYCKGKGKYTCKLHKVLIFAEKGYIKKIIESITEQNRVKITFKGKQLGCKMSQFKLF